MNEAAVTKRTRIRSPNYPYFNLETAVEKTQKLYEVIGRHAVGPEVLIKTLGYTAKSSSGKKAIGALRAFGLIDDIVEGGDKLSKLSSGALDIVADYAKGDPGWAKAVSAAASSPRIHAEVLRKYPKGLPPNDELRRYLVRSHEPAFSDAGADDFIAELRATLKYAGDQKPEGDTPDNGTGDSDPPASQLEVGSLVQWTSQGQDQFPTPRKLVGVTEDGVFGFVEGTETGVPMSELAVVDPPKKPDVSHDRPRNPFLAAAPNTQNTPSLEGPVVRFPLAGGDNEVVISLKKPISKKDFERITKLLELSEDSLVGEALD